jgi:ubiquinone biosynthesis monooxygenase Coq7
MLNALPPRDALTIKRIVRVNHAGEYGAIRIYSAQIAIARRLWPDLVPALREMLADEVRHCDKFHAAMPARQSRPCRVMQFWSFGGWALGTITALLGRNTIWICTAAVEEAVHRHLDEQMNYLRLRDAELYDVIASIRSEELAHLDHAENELKAAGAKFPALRKAIAAITELLIWLSTWGDSQRMASALRAAKA